MFVIFNLFLACQVILRIQIFTHNEVIIIVFSGLSMRHCFGIVRRGCMFGKLLLALSQLKLRTQVLSVMGIVPKILEHVLFCSFFFREKNIAFQKCSFEKNHMFQNVPLIL